MPSGGMRIWAGLAILLVLTGCGGLADRIEFAGNVQAARDRTDRVLGMASAAFVSMPVAGSVEYTGHAALVFGPPAAEIMLLGETRVTANFDTARVTGQVDNFFGGTGAADVRDYAGSLTIAGDIGLRRPNSFDAAIAGSVSGGGQTIVLDGALLGDFRGTGGRAIVAATTPVLEATINGDPGRVRVRLIVEQ